MYWCVCSMYVCICTCVINSDDCPGSITGNHGLVDERRAGGDDPIGGDTSAGQDFADISALHRVDVD